MKKRMLSIEECDKVYERFERSQSDQRVADEMDIPVKLVTHLRRLLFLNGGSRYRPQATGYYSSNVPSYEERMRAEGKWALGPGESNHVSLWVKVSREVF